MDHITTRDGYLNFILIGQPFMNKHEILKICVNLLFDQMRVNFRMIIDY